MAPQHDRLGSFFQTARRIGVDVSPLLDGFEDRVLAGLGRQRLAGTGVIASIPSWNPAPVFAALCLLVLAWTLITPEAHFDLLGSALSLFDMESLGQVLPSNLTVGGLLS
jgi:hypothetical protein